MFPCASHTSGQSSGEGSASQQGVISPAQIGTTVPYAAAADCCEAVARNSNSVMNITLVSDHLNKRKIGAKAPSVYIGDFADQNSNINLALNSHFIDLKGFGIGSNDYQQFLTSRAVKVFAHLKSRIELTHIESKNEDIEELILEGEVD